MNELFSRLTFVTALAGSLLPAPALGADDTCKTVLDATNKVIVTPTHVYYTETAASRGNQPRNSEMIYTGGVNGAIYVMVGGKWTRSKMTAGEMLKQQEENRRTAKPSCQYLRAEPVNGEAAAVYSGRSDTEDAKSSMTIWISKANGLPLRQDLDIDVGGGGGKRHRTMRYDYTNVHPPTGVQ